MLVLLLAAAAAAASTCQLSAVNVSAVSGHELAFFWLTARPGVNQSDIKTSSEQIIKPPT